MPATEYFFIAVNNQIANTIALAAAAILIVVFLLLIAGVYAKKKHGQLNPFIIIGLACLAAGFCAIW